MAGLNRVVNSISELQLVTDQTLLGHIVHRRDYAPGAGVRDSGIVLQAALVIPGGLGIVAWDSDVYATLRETPGGLSTEPHMRFLPFEQLEPAIKALLLPHVESLLLRLIQLASPLRRE